MDDVEEYEVLAYRCKGRWFSSNPGRLMTGETARL